MYSPKIAEPLIPVLYRLARHRSMPMTALVSEALAEYLSRQPDARELLRQAAAERRMRGIASLRGDGASGGASGDA